MKKPPGEGTGPTIHDEINHPYQAIGIALAVGAFISYFATRRRSRNGNS